MSKRGVLESTLERWSYQINSTKMLIGLTYRDQTVLVLHLKPLRTFIDELFNGPLEESRQARLSQVSLAFLAMYRKRYPTTKKALKDFNVREQHNFGQILDLIDGFNKKYEIGLTYQKYLSVHFAFYANNFNTAPKPSFFITDNAVRRTDEMIQHFNGKWPSEADLAAYFKDNLSPASPKAKAEVQKKNETTHDIRLTGLQIWTTDNDSGTALKDNSRFQSLKARVLNETATIYEARYVRDCYDLRDSRDTMPPEVEDYIEMLEALANKTGVKLK